MKRKMKQKMKQSLRLKFSVIGISLIMFFVLLNILATYLCLVPFSTVMSTNTMKKIAVEIESRIDLPEDEFQEYIEELNEDYSFSISVFDDDKKIIATTRDTDGKTGTANKIVSKIYNEEKSVLDEGKTVVRTWEVKGKAIDPIRIHVIKKLKENLYVDVTKRISNLKNTSRIVIWFELIAGVVIVILSYLVVLRLSKHLVKPIDEMMSVAEHISDLEFDTKLLNTGEDELGRLAASINRMSQHLESNIFDLQNDIERRKILVRNLSHEIKSPVAVIMGYADRMQTVLEKYPEKALEYSKIISNESGRIDTLVKEMLDYSKLEQNVGELLPEIFDVRRLFVNISDRMHEEYMERLYTLDIEYNENDRIRADYGMLERAVYNIVNNAFSHGTGENLQIKVSGILTGGEYCICVHNTGSHIPEEELAFVWEAFYKIDKARVRNKNGCGIGLSIVREIVEAHRGSYEAGNDETGVYFIIRIPQNI